MPKGMVDDAKRAQRARRLKDAQVSGRVSRRSDVWAGQPAAIYCRISHTADEDQTGVERQERICREVADRLGLVVDPGMVFVDNNRSAWQRNRQRKGWDQLLKAAREGRVQHVVAYHPDRLMRQPKDLEELLSIADDGDITLHGQANRRELSDPDDRFFLRIEVAHACRSSDDTSRRIKAATVERANDGLPRAGGIRRYGYDVTGMVIVSREAVIVKEIFTRYLDGDRIQEIADDLNARQVPPPPGHRPHKCRATAISADPGMEQETAAREWTYARVWSILKTEHFAGILKFRGEVVGPGEWEPIIDAGLWAEVQDRRRFRASENNAKYEQKRFYLLRGLIMCDACDRPMQGAILGDKDHMYRKYRCANRIAPGQARCVRTAVADKVESFVTEAALYLLENLTSAPAQAPSTSLSAQHRAEVAEIETELIDLKDMWKARELKTHEYREMKAVLDSRLGQLQARTVVRPTATVLKDITGDRARPAWQAMSENGEYERQNAILRFLFSAVNIGPATPGRRFDYSRVTIQESDL